MEASVENEKTARTIINVLAENGCTVAQASSILRFVDGILKQNALVQDVDKPLFETKLS